MIYIVSDTHFRNNNHHVERKKREDFFKLLKRIEKDDILILNGDFFDFYFDKGRFIPRYYFPILSELTKLKEKGVKIIYIPGNHDHWLGDFFKENGIEVTDEYKFGINGKTFYITHGHWISAGKIKGFVSKLILTNPIHVFLFSLLPAEMGYFIADFISLLSRIYGKINKKGIEGNRFLRKYIKNVYEEKKKLGVDVIIVGHFHYPYDGDGMYITGDFMNGRHYMVIDKKGNVKREKL